MSKRKGGQKWIKFKKNLILKRGHKCEKCGKKTMRLIGDHIRTIYFGGKEFDPKNVQLLCTKCDKQKTKRDLSIISWFRNL